MNIEDILNQGLEELPVEEPSRPPSNGLLEEEMASRKPGFAVEMLKTIDYVEEYSMKRGEMGGMDWGFEGFNKAFEGLNAGVHLIAGQSNIGKSGLCMQLAWQIAQANQLPTPERPQKAFVLYFSLDDSVTELLPRMIAIDQKIKINVVRFPKKHADDIKSIERMEEGYRRLRESVMNIYMSDVNKGSSIEFIEEHTAKIAQELSLIDPAYQVVLVIDNFHDVTVDTPGYTDDSARYNHIADQLSRIASRFDAPIICTAEFRKLGGTRRPQLEDIRESVKIIYEAKAIILSYNEVSYRGDQANIFWTDPTKPDVKMPVYECQVGKNKYGSYKGRMFFDFWPEMSRFYEVKEAQEKQYNQMING